MADTSSFRELTEQTPPFPTSDGEKPDFSPMPLYSWSCCNNKRLVQPSYFQDTDYFYFCSCLLTSGTYLGFW